MARLCEEIQSYLQHDEGRATGAAANTLAVDRFLAYQVGHLLPLSLLPFFFVCVCVCVCILS